MNERQTPERRRMIQVTAIVVTAAGLIWIGGSWLGGQLGWPPRYAFLLDFAALGAFAWVIGSIVMLRMGRQKEK